MPKDYVSVCCSLYTSLLLSVFVWVSYGLTWNFPQNPLLLNTESPEDNAIFELYNCVYVFFMWVQWYICVRMHLEARGQPWLSFLGC